MVTDDQDIIDLTSSDPVESKEPGASHRAPGLDESRPAPTQTKQSLGLPTPPPTNVPLERVREMRGNGSPSLSFQAHNTSTPANLPLAPATCYPTPSSLARPIPKALELERKTTRVSSHMRRRRSPSQSPGRRNDDLNPFWSTPMSRADVPSSQAPERSPRPIRPLPRSFQHKERRGGSKMPDVPFVFSAGSRAPKQRHAPVEQTSKLKPASHESDVDIVPSSQTQELGLLDDLLDADEVSPTESVFEGSAGSDIVPTSQSQERELIIPSPPFDAPTFRADLSRGEIVPTSRRSEEELGDAPVLRFRLVSKAAVRSRSSGVVVPGSPEHVQSSQSQTERELEYGTTPWLDRRLQPPTPRLCGDPLPPAPRLNTKYVHPLYRVTYLINRVIIAKRHASHCTQETSLVHIHHPTRGRNPYKHRALTIHNCTPLHFALLRPGMTTLSQAVTMATRTLRSCSSPPNFVDSGPCLTLPIARVKSLMSQVRVRTLSPRVLVPQARNRSFLYSSRLCRRGKLPRRGST